VIVAPGSAAVGKSLSDLELGRFHVEVTAIRRRNIRSSSPDPDTRLTEGDVVVLRGAQDELALAEMFLLQG
jgi:monovalent cation:H+ antiporter-2, CPA2 family